LEVILLPGNQAVGANNLQNLIEERMRHLNLDYNLMRRKRKETAKKVASRSVHP
jgi:hypothetical protein